jgi:cell division inhibitor SepF
MGRIMQRMWSFLGFNEDEDGDAAPVARPGGPQGEAGGHRAPIFSLHAQRQMEIIVLEPAAFDEAQAAADYLKTQRPIVINLRGAEDELGKRIVDFLSGVTYALDGHMHRVGEEIFLFAPHHVFITAERLREQVAPSPLFPVEE